MKKMVISGLLLLLCLGSKSQEQDLLFAVNEFSIAGEIDNESKRQNFLKLMSEKISQISSVQNLTEIKEFKNDCVNPSDYLRKSSTSILIEEETNKIKYLKKQYSIKDYKYIKTDKYNPDISFLLSLIPLTGHLYVGEPLRGFVFLCGTGFSYFSLGYGLELAFSDNPFGLLLSAIGAVGIPVFFFWRIIDVAKITKVKNLAFRDKAISININPSFEPKNQIIHANTFGVKIALKF